MGDSPLARPSDPDHQHRNRAVEDVAVGQADSRGRQPRRARDGRARCSHRDAQLVPGHPLSDVRRVRHKITVPTMYVWSDGDTALLEKGARDCRRYVSGKYRFEILHGTHWILDEQPDAVASLLLE